MAEKHAVQFIRSRQTRSQSGLGLASSASCKSPTLISGLTRRQTNNGTSCPLPHPPLRPLNGTELFVLATIPVFGQWRGLPYSPTVRWGGSDSEEPRSAGRLT
jgi:hypothetical protein